MQEILLSYRLIFGQSRLARSLFRNEEQKVLKSEGLVTDPLLSLLCGKKFGRDIKRQPTQIWPETCLSSPSAGASLLEQSVYGCDEDFPIFRERLMALERFAQRQDPRTVWSMWQDRRNPVQWLAFWAVLIIGGATILLGLLQLVVTILQLFVNHP